MPPIIIENYKKKTYVEEQKYPYIQKLFFYFLVQDPSTGPYHGHQTQVTWV
jgi:hypothetical protein